MYADCDTVVLKVGKSYDWIFLDPQECDYVVDVVEPFLGLSTKRGSEFATMGVKFEDNEGTKYNVKIKDVLVEGGLKVYYHADVKQFNETLFESQRCPGMIDSFLGAIETIIPVQQGN